MSRQGAFTLTATGDLMFYGPLADRMARHDDLLWGFRSLGDALRQGDILFGNFETPISVARRSAPGFPGAYFSPPGVARALKSYGYDVVNLAHNHIYDFGAEGVEATLAEMAEASLAHFGIGRDADEASRPAVVVRPDGRRAGFLGYTTAHPVLNPKNAYVACFPHPERVAADVRRLRQDVDAVIVSCHTGAQYNPYPSPEARALARAAIESGAAVYLGHHPHVPQGVERIGRGLAVYSLGDFVAPVHNEQTRRTFIVRIRIEGDLVHDYELVPCFITDDCRTTLAQGGLRDEIAAHLDELCRGIAEGRSDDLHFAFAGDRVFSQYLRCWREEWRQAGPKMFLRKFANLRPYHFQLIIRTLAGRLGLRRKAKPR